MQHMALLPETRLLANVKPAFPEIAHDLAGDAVGAQCGALPAQQRHRRKQVCAPHVRIDARRKAIQKPRIDVYVITQRLRGEHLGSVAVIEIQSHFAATVLAAQLQAVIPRRVIRIGVEQARAEIAQLRPACQRLCERTRLHGEFFASDVVQAQAGRL